MTRLKKLENIKDKIRKWMKNLNITQNVVCIFCDEISVAKTCQLDTSDIKIRSKCRTIFCDAIPMAKSWPGRRQWRKLPQKMLYHFVMRFKWSWSTQVTYLVIGLKPVTSMLCTTPSVQGWSDDNQRKVTSHL